MDDNERNRWSATCFSIFVLGCMATVFAGLASSGLGRDEVRQAAIDHNCAEWRIDAKTGQREFVWLGKALIEKEVEGE